MKRFFKAIISLIMTATLAIGASGCALSEWYDRQKCAHVWNAGTLTKAATCADFGAKLYKCQKCGTEKTEELQKLPHTEKEIPQKDPTCTEDGYAAYWGCEVCGFELTEPKVLPALGHNEIYIPGVAATCTGVGGSDFVFCDRCEEVLQAQEKTPAKGHDLLTIPGKPSTCLEKGYSEEIICRECSTVIKESKELPIAAHNFADGKCTTCGVLEDPTSVKIEAGEKLVGGYYRIYKDYDETINFWNAYMMITTSKGTFSLIPGDEYVLEGMVSWQFETSLNVKKSGWTYWETDEYIDVYIESGSVVIAVPKFDDFTSTTIKVDETFTIDETTTIKSATGRVYRLIP